MRPDQKPLRPSVERFEGHTAPAPLSKGARVEAVAAIVAEHEHLPRLDDVRSLERRPRGLKREIGAIVDELDAKPSADGTPLPVRRDIKIRSGVAIGDLPVVDHGYPAA